MAGARGVSVLGGVQGTCGCGTEGGGFVMGHQQQLRAGCDDPEGCVQPRYDPNQTHLHERHQGYPLSNRLCPLETTCLQGAISGDPMKAGSIKGIQASSQEAAPASPVPLHAQPHFQGNKSADNCAPLTARNIPPLPGLR